MIKVTVLGSGTSVGVPTIGCRCAVCHSADLRDRRLRPSILVQFEDRNIVIDTTPDFRQQMLRAGVTRLDAVLYTHAHADHILGLDDLRPFNFFQQQNIPIYATPETFSVIERVFSYVFDGRVTESSRPRVEVRFLDGSPFDLFGLTVEPIPLRHGSGHSYGFRFGNFAYLTDHSEIPEDSLALLHGLDVLFLDALRHKPHPTHSTVDKSLEYVRRLAPRRTFFTHLSHDLAHVQTESRLPPHVHLAYDGLEIEVDTRVRFRVSRGLDDAPNPAPPSVLTIGNFDGAHRGHQALFAHVADLAREHSLTPALLTFDPHPLEVVAPARAPKLLTTHERRTAAMRQAGIEQVYILPFDQEVAALSPTDFATGILRDRLNAQTIVVGDNFRFGARQAGDARTLRELGFQVEVLPHVAWHGRMVSSTNVRNLLGEGEVAWAARLLGGFYGIDGQVVSGDGIGRTQTVPTLNLDSPAAVLPAHGVYVTRTFDLDSPRQWRSITNIGVRPTFGRDELRVETYLLDPLSDPSPHRIRVEFLHRVRNERKFRNAEELKAQILRDVRRAESWFRHAHRVQKKYQ